jgi:hypothetical protein
MFAIGTTVSWRIVVNTGAETSGVATLIACGYNTVYSRSIGSSGSSVHQYN